MIYQKNKRIRKLVFSGGGVNGISFIGCLKSLEYYQIIKDITTIIGTSAGSIMSLLINIGYTSNELLEVIFHLDMNLLKDITSEYIIDYFTHFGIDSGNKMMKALEVFLKQKDVPENITFQELYNNTGIHLIITGTNMTHRKTDFFEYKEYPNMEVLTAIRISISIPFIFRKMIYNECVYVDGSLMANYPIYHIKDKEDTIGFLIIDNGNNYDVNTFDSYMISILKCMSKQDDTHMVKHFGEHTIILDNTSNLFQFGISKEDKQDIFDKGYRATNDYLTKNYHPRLPIQLINEINKKI